MKFPARLIVLSLVLFRELPVLALVDPAATTLPVPGWMTDIEVWVDSDNRPYQFCKGALIAPQWILSTGLCLADPNHYLDHLYTGEDPQFFVRLGPTRTVVEVEKFFTSDDYRIGLFRIPLPSEDQPLALTSRTAAQLLGQQVFILGTHKSAAVYSAFYNPGVAAASVSCTMNGVEFYLDGALCYLLGKPVTGSTVYRSSATVIDPLAVGAPATTLDKAALIDTSGKHLYLDFRAQKSYPCVEDMGAPVLITRADGGQDLAGIVAGVGMSLLLPVCGMSMVNEFISAEAIRAFADKTMAAYDFSARCPQVPEPTASYSGAGNITLSWQRIKNATGYKVHYTTRYGHVPFESADLKNHTSLTTTLRTGVEYRVAVSAYNAACSSGISTAVPVNIPQ